MISQLLEWDSTHTPKPFRALKRQRCVCLVKITTVTHQTFSNIIYLTENAYDQN